MKILDKYYNNQKKKTLQKQYIKYMNIFTQLINNKGNF